MPPSNPVHGPCGDPRCAGCGATGPGLIRTTNPVEIADLLSMGAAASSRDPTTREEWLEEAAAIAAERAELEEMTVECVRELRARGVPWRTIADAIAIPEASLRRLVS